MLPEPKDRKLTVLVAENDMTRLRELAAADDVSAAHVVRSLIRAAHAGRFKKPKTKREP
jgi:hypothetical protein